MKLRNNGQMFPFDFWLQLLSTWLLTLDSFPSFHPIAPVAESSCQSRFAVMPLLLSTLLDKGHENQVFRELTLLLISQTFCLVLANISAILIVVSNASRKFLTSLTISPTANCRECS